MAEMAMTVPHPARIPVTVSATLAASEAMAVRRKRGDRVLPLGFGEAGLPVHPALRAALAGAAGRNDYGPVAGLPALREAAAGYWERRGLPTGPAAVVCGPGSKPLLYGLLLALGTEVAMARPSWVSYAAQAAMTGRPGAPRAHPARRGRRSRPGPAGPGRHRRARRRPADRLGDRDAARQPDRDAGGAGHRAGPVRGGGRA